MKIAWGFFKKILRRTRLKSWRYAMNLLWYESFYYGKTGLYTFRWAPWLFSRFKPRLFELEVTTRCPLRCKMCEHTYWQEPEKNVSLEQFKRVAAQFRGFVWCGLTGIGTSQMNPDFMPILRYIRKEISQDVFIELYDHFNFIGNEQCRDLVDLKIDFMLISLDGSNQEVYENIRPGANFKTVIKNIQNLISAKKERDSFFPELAFHYIISRDNFEDVPEFVSFVCETFGADCCKYLYFTAILHPFPEIKNLAVTVDSEIIAETEKRAAVYGIKVIWNVNIQKEKPPLADCRAWLEPFIFSDGTVIPCCAGNERNNREYQRRHRMGNIFESPLLEIWRGEQYTNFRKELLNRRTPAACRFCPVRKFPLENLHG